MKKNIKTIIGVIIGIVIGISSTVGAATVFNSKDITYSSSATSKTNVKDSLDELYSKVGNGGECPEGWICTRPISIVSVGDYISMTPTSTSYTIAKASTGQTADQSINPSELNIWRVLRKNSDGTVEAVSENVSSKQIYFSGQTGYKNFVGVLNTIAAQYTNEKYVQSTRHIGYSNQTLTCTAVNTATACPADTGYETDTNLVQAAIGSLIANYRGLSWNGTEINASGDYWLASRLWASSKTMGGRVVDSGNISESVMVWNSTSTSESRRIRPIITLRADILIFSGDGKSAETAYQLT